jgi:hypothetical protein
MNLTIDIDAKALIAALEKAPVKINAGLNDWISKSAFRTTREAKLQVPPNIDTGRLQNSIHTTIGNLKAVVKPTASYALYIHEGRKPGGKLPPYQEGTQLNRWATKKGMNPYLVARSIARNGTKPNRFMDKAFTSVKPLADRDASRILEEIVRSI